jgi:Skp family chaperone for outer membrane proteins
MNQRIKRLAQQVAQSSGRDCVVRKGDIGDAKGMEVTDLTDDVIGKIDS